MVKEIIQQNEESLILHIQKSNVYSIQRKSIEKTGLRLYKDGYIGVTGAIGPTQEKELEKKAMELLKMQIPYSPGPTQHLSHRVSLEGLAWEESAFIMTIESLIKEMCSLFPTFSFSHNARWTRRVDSMQNDDGLSLSYDDSYLEMDLLFKHRNSVELIDGSVGCRCRQFDRSAFLQYCQEVLSSYEKVVDLPSKSTFPVIFLSGFQTLFFQFFNDLNSRSIATKGSRLHDKIGMQHYHRAFTFYQSHHPHYLFKPFYDAEGTYHADTDYRVPLIQDGFIVQGYADKRTAKEFSCPLTGSAISEFDGLPTLGFPSYEVKPGTKSLAELLDGRQGILVSIASGGDFTPQGDFATPVQKAYLVEGNTMVGRLPPLQLNSHVDKMFGENFIGVSREPVYPLNQDYAIVMELPVKTI